MASVVDTSVKNFNSTMSGAPALSGTAGTLIALLDAVLVNGFDVKTASGLTVAGGVASLPFTGAHSAQLDSVISISGITGTYASLNGEQKVTAVGAGVVRFATNLPDGTASGTISFKMAPAGWEKVASASGKATYRSLDPMSTKAILRVDDTAAQTVRVIGYESMTDIDTGIGPFPTSTQMSGGGYWAKSTAANSTPNPWAVHADSRIFYFTVLPGFQAGPTVTNGVTRCFGDFAALRPGGDAYACGLSYSSTNVASSQTDGGVGSPGNIAQFAFPRSHTGLGSSALYYKFAYPGIAAPSGIVASAGSFPSEVDGTLIVEKQYVSLGTTAAPRANFPGVYHSCQSLVWDSFKFLDVAPGADSLAGRTLHAMTCTNTTFGGAAVSSSTGVLWIDRTGPWR
ncbi:hypothetical protein [Variovorax atrisoli]|uniref:hypothetical protein n=1 Tax=Variovorax atrisoli TaxID=3394203 RepID=UPI0033978C0E